MGKLADYEIIESVIEYTDDPLKIGRIRASIPGVLDHSEGHTEKQEALPWIRPFKMYCYQTFTKPMPGQKVWILMNKTNHNEFWWFPFFETIDIVQGYLNEYYDETPDVFHSREEFISPVMSTWDNKQGYRDTIGEDFIDFFPDRTYHLNIHDCDIHVTDDNYLKCGGDESKAGEYEPAVMGYKCWQLRQNMRTWTEAVQAAAASIGCPAAAPLKQLALAMRPDDHQKLHGSGILCEKCWVN